MISLHDIAREYGLSDKEAAAILELPAALLRIGLDRYEMNTPMATYFRKLLAPHTKAVAESQPLERVVRYPFITE